MDDKVIVTNRSALIAKYGNRGLTRIKKAIAALVSSDRARGIHSSMIFLDDPGSMKKAGAKAVTNARSPRETKAAIDGVCKTLQPDYLLILGAPDVVTHQDLQNPAFSAGDDDDPTPWGDLPYACDAPYSRDPARFIGPTRVVGRVPDLFGAREPTYLLRLLANLLRWKSRPTRAYAPYFGLSAEVWKKSTQLSLQNIFGNDLHLRLSPPRGPRHPKVLSTLAHFINCHGAPAAPEFYGQDRSEFPVALTTTALHGAISKGTVAAVECCYGGELYDSLTLNLEIPICQKYLDQGAYGYFGSTTIAYGPADENGAADLVCQFFLLNVLQGASVGRAALMARQQFVAQTGQMDPLDLKTIAQFCVYGDPSVHPVGPVLKAAPLKGMTPAGASRFLRSERRAKLKLEGEFLRKTKPTASRKESVTRIPGASKAALASIATKAGLPADTRFAAFKVKGAERRPGQAAKISSSPSRYYVAVSNKRAVSQSLGKLKVALVAKELAGRIVGFRIYQSR